MQPWCRYMYRDSYLKEGFVHNSRVDRRGGRYWYSCGVFLLRWFCFVLALRALLCVVLRCLAFVLCVPVGMS